MESLFAPSSIAVVGASSVTGKIGNTILANILSAGFKGEVFAVNPRGGDICGLKAFKSIADIHRSVDLGIIAVPRDLVLQSFRELLRIGVRSVIVITAGFKEVDHDGWLLETELAALAREGNVNLLGRTVLA